MKILTKRKQAWVQKRKPEVLQGDPLNPSAAVGLRYAQNIVAQIEQMTQEVEREIKKLFDSDHAQEYFAEDATTSAQARILTNFLLKKFNGRFAKKAKPMAESFANQADKASSASVHSSIQKLSGGLSLPTSALTPDMKEILSATITENVGLIKSISQKYLTDVQGAVMRSITTQTGAVDLLPILLKSKEITLRRANLIALDQTRKAMGNLGKARMENIGIEEYKWLHTGGSDHPRHLHQKMSGNIYRFDNPPVIDERTGERGIPGQAIYCRCRMVPVIKFT